jgi:hypothetical protein
VPLPQVPTRCLPPRTRAAFDDLVVSDALRDKVTDVTAGDPQRSTPTLARRSSQLEQTEAVTDDPTERRNEPGSDHRPVVVSLEL